MFVIVVGQKFGSSNYYTNTPPPRRKFYSAGPGNQTPNSVLIEELRLPTPEQTPLECRCEIIPNTMLHHRFQFHQYPFRSATIKSERSFRECAIVRVCARTVFTRFCVSASARVSVCNSAYSIVAVCVSACVLWRLYGRVVGGSRWVRIFGRLLTILEHAPPPPTTMTTTTTIASLL